jgi:N-acetylglutamate synthase-like GNAT family acetyltransferase
MALIIRRTIEDDIPVLAHIVAENYSRAIAESFTDEMLMTFAPYPYRPFFYTAIQDGEPIGCAGYVAAWLAYGTFTLSWVNVAKSLHGRGIGRQLVDRCLHDLKAKATFVILATSVPEFYSKNWGFQTIADMTAENEKLGTVVMSLNI